MKDQNLWLERNDSGSLVLNWTCDTKECAKTTGFPIKDDQESMFLLCSCGNKLMLSDTDIHILISAYMLGTHFIYAPEKGPFGLR